MAALEFLQNNLHVLGIVMMFCMVQSVFGMGLLIFGTPTLIILDVPFFECLIHLIPASLTISLLQVIPERSSWHLNTGKSIPLLALAVTVGFLIHKLPLGQIRLDGLLAIVMLCYGLSRLFTRIGTIASKFVRQRYTAMLVAMGVLHGVSNMGGTLLAILSSARYSDKNDLRAFVAANYAVLAGSQFMILLFAMENKHILTLLTSSAVALAVYTLIGRHIFGAIGARFFHNLFTVFIFSYSAALFWKYSLSG
jgi:hypothetical protein